MKLLLAVGDGGLASPAKSLRAVRQRYLILGQVVGDLREGVTIGREITDLGDRRRRHLRARTRHDALALAAASASLVSWEISWRSI
jgi:hypothetical protein